MKAKKTIAVLLAIAMMLALLGGCGQSGTQQTQSTEAAQTEADQTASESTASAKTYKAYCIAPDSGSAWTRFKQGMEDACAELGWEGTLLAPTQPYNAVEMAELCETAVNAGADVIMIFTADTEFFKDVIEDAKAKGVYMISVAKPNEYCDLRVGTDDVAFGENIAKALVEEMGDTPIKVVEMMSDVTSMGQMGQINPFEAKLKELAPDAEIVSRIDCNYNTATAADNMSATYVAHPEANCAISIDGDGAVGISSFVTDYGIQDSFVVIGVDDDASILNCMLEGTMNCSVVNQWYEYGVRCINLSYEHLVNGQDFEFNQGVDSLILHPEEAEAYAIANNIDLNR